MSRRQAVATPDIRPFSRQEKVNSLAKKKVPSVPKAKAGTSGSRNPQKSPIHKARAYSPYEVRAPFYQESLTEEEKKNMMRFEVPRITPDHKQWWELSEERDESRRQENKQSLHKHPNRFKPTPVPKDWTTKKILHKIQEKIMQHCKEADQTRFILMAMGKSKGLELTDFQEMLSERFGLVCSPEQVADVIEMFDEDGDGIINLMEFLHHVMPDHFQGESWHEKSHKKSEEARKEKLRVIDDCHSSGGHLYKPAEIPLHWDIHEIEHRLQRKLLQHVKKDTDQLKFIFHVFGHSAECMNVKQFQEAINEFGLALSDDQAQMMFEAYDADKSGDISMLEFVQRLFRKTKPIASKAAREAERKMFASLQGKRNFERERAINQDRARRINGRVEALHVGEVPGFLNIEEMKKKQQRKDYVIERVKSRLNYNARVQEQGQKEIDIERQRQKRNTSSRLSAASRIQGNKSRLGRKALKAQAQHRDGSGKKSIGKALFLPLSSRTVTRALSRQSCMSSPPNLKMSCIQSVMGNQNENERDDDTKAAQNQVEQPTALDRQRKQAVKFGSTPEKRYRSGNGFKKPSMERLVPSMHAVDAFPSCKYLARSSESWRKTLRFKKKRAKAGLTQDAADEEKRMMRLESRLKIHRQIEIERAKQLTPTIKVTQTGKYDQGHGKKMVTRIFEDLN